VSDNAIDLLKDRGSSPAFRGVVFTVPRLDHEFDTMTLIWLDPGDSLDFF
jgi:hypothetical protein